MTDSTPRASAACYCRQCGYDVRATIDPPRCPECGRVFDPTDPRTTRRWPIRHWVRHVKRAAYALLTLTVLLAAVWGWFFWGWYDEQQALAALRARSVAAESLAPRLRAFPGGFVFDRIKYVNCSASGLTDLAPIARLHRLQRLSCYENPVRDLRPLAKLRQLHEVNLGGTNVTDLTPLAGLKNLEFVALWRTPITDISPLAGLTHLSSLYLTETPVQDIAPLAGLKELTVLMLRGTRITDVRPLAPRRAFNSLTLPKQTITEEQAESLRRALPGSNITRE